MDPSFFLAAAPPLHSSWLAHEQATGLDVPKDNVIILTSAQNQEGYNQLCASINARQMGEGGPETQLRDVEIKDDTVIVGDGFQVPIRTYSSSSSRSNSKSNRLDERIQMKETEEVFQGESDTVIYFHGGGLFVGDLDSEDLSCRRICYAGNGKTRVISVAYRLMPEWPPQKALDDCYEAVTHILNTIPGHIILCGSSSGGQLAAQLVMLLNPEQKVRVKGVLLRGPVLVDASKPEYIPAAYRGLHHSFSAGFATSLLKWPCGVLETKVESSMPFNSVTALLTKLPRTWIQVCTNDFFYSDGICYADALLKAGTDVRVDVRVGWPHTFWLKAPWLDGAVEAESEMLKGLEWIFERID